VILLAYVIGSLALACGTGLVFLGLLKMEGREDMGSVSPGWRMRHVPPPKRENETDRILPFRRVG
jgi:hypothetical protein